MFLAEKAAEVIGDLDDLNKTELRFVKNSSASDIETCIFEDLSMIRSDGHDFSISKPRNIENVKFDSIKIKESFFNKKMNKFEKILLKENNDENGVLQSYCKISISNNKKIGMGIDSVYILDGGDTFSLSPSKKNKKVLDSKEKRSLFKELNIDPNLLNDFVIDCKERIQRKQEYNSDIGDNTVLAFLNKNKKKEDQEVKSRSDTHRPEGRCFYFK